jgi:hypothetical protein
VVITNAYGSVNSSIATLTLIAPPPPPILPGIAGNLVNGQFQVSFINPIPNASYNVLSTTNLAAPMAAWVVVAVSSNMPAGNFQFSIPVGANEAARFYRLQLLQ